MKHEAGFVLADALVALLICSLFLTSFLSFNVTSQKTASRAHDRLVAAYVARAVLEDPSIREDAGDFVIRGKAFHWLRMDTQRASAEADRVVLSDIQVTVSWAAGSGADASITARTVRLRSANDAG